MTTVQVWALTDTSDLLTVSDDSPEEAVEAEHGEHDGQVAQDAHRIAQLVDQQEPLVHHPEKHTINKSSLHDRALLFF